jgi:hypothetical protein
MYLPRSRGLIISPRERHDAADQAHVLASLARADDQRDRDEHQRHQAAGADALHHS